MYFGSVKVMPIINATSHVVLYQNAFKILAKVLHNCSLLKGALWSFFGRKQKFAKQTFSVSHQKTLHASLKSNKSVKHSFFLIKHLQSQFFENVKPCLHPSLLACGLLLYCLLWLFSLLLWALQPPTVNQWKLW